MPLALLHIRRSSSCLLLAPQQRWRLESFGLTVLVTLGLMLPTTTAAAPDSLSPSPMPTLPMNKHVPTGEKPSPMPSTLPNGAPVNGPGSAADERARITADELVYDKTLHTVTARGGVEIQYDGRILSADTVSYQIDRDYATANGHVAILERDGTTLFADHVELDEKLRNGFIKQAQVILADGSRAAASTATRTEGNITILDHAVYSACDSCDPDGPPLWQIKAIRVVRDRVEKVITYRNAWLELGGIPIFYTPYLSHPDPSVKRQSGFLAPRYGATSALGMTITTPYYVALSPYQDATLSPTFTTKEGIVLGGQYRIKGRKGELTVGGSITQDSHHEIRNHVKLTTQMALNDRWRARADMALASDDTYLRKYGLHSPSFLVSRPRLEGFGQRTYTALEGYYFQNLRESSAITEEAPIVFPEARWSYSSAPDDLGAYQSVDVSLAALDRRTSASVRSRRLSTSYGWHLPHIGSIGDVYQLDLSVRGDAYNVQNVALDDGGVYTGTLGRVVPKAAFTYSMPFSRQHEAFQEVIEPTIQAVVSPRGQNDPRIPNEDSRDFEFDDTNLFSTDRFTGYDRVEGGTRINYGLRYSTHNADNSQLDFIMGQSWHANTDDMFSTESGLAEEFSDYVGRAQFRLSDNLDMLYRFRLDKDTIQAHLNELAVRVGPPLMRFTGKYTMLDGSAFSRTNQDDQEELKAGVRTQLSRYWTVSMSSVHDLRKGGSPLKTGIVASYDDDCFTVDLSATRDFTYDRDYENGYQFGLRVVFKTLGEFQTSTRDSSITRN